MAVAANDGHTRLGDAELRPDDVHNALIGVPQAVEFHTKLFAVLGQFIHLKAGQFLPDGQMLIFGGHVVVGRSHGLLWAEDRNAPFFQTRKRLRARHLVDEVAVDVEDLCILTYLRDEVVVPDFIE